MVARAIRSLEKLGQLDNTIVVVTSDHGMPFPRAKASLYDAGTHVPLAIRWPEGIRKPGRVFHSLVNLSDLAPTFLEAAGLKVPGMMTANSLLDVFGIRTREKVWLPSSPWSVMTVVGKGGKGYPCRAIRTKDYIYILNHNSDRWPAGNSGSRILARYIPSAKSIRLPPKPC